MAEKNAKQKQIKANILPSSYEAEQAILATILIDENSSVKILPYVKEDDFYHSSHKKIYHYMYELYKSNKPVDLITLTNILEENNCLEEVGGIDYITALTNILPGASNYRYYLDIIKNTGRRRSLISVSQEIIDYSFETEDGQQALQFAEKKIFEISQNEQISDLKHINTSLSSVLDKFDSIAKDSTKMRGVPSGFKELDEITNGFQKSDLILLAARPGMGKTTLAMNIVNNAAVDYGKTCAIFSLEMSLEQLTQRSLCSVGCVPMQNALNGTMTELEWNAIWMANKKLNNAKIYIDDSALTTPMDVRSKCMRLKRNYGLDLIMIDYLGLMSSGSNKKDLNKTNEIAEITRQLKITAKELNVPIILLSQLSRSVEQRKEDHKPMLSDLRDSGAIEQDADIVLFIYNPDKYNDVINEDGQGIVQIEIAKHRNGKVGTVKLRWISEWLKFVDRDYNYKQQASVEESGEDVTQIQSNNEINDVFDEPTPPPEDEGGFYAE